jgi:uncharacterized phage protein (TIGR01671 family)
MTDLLNKREIRFRAWHNETEQMLFVGDAFGTTHPLDCAVYAKTQDVVLMQYTGLKDKSGVEIYDQEILSLWCQADTNDYEMLALVFWDDVCFRWSLKCFHPSGHISIETLEEVAGEPDFIESKGNIYQNPDLLKP